MMPLSIEKPYARIGVFPVEHVFNTVLLNLFALKLMVILFFSFKCCSLRTYTFFQCANFSFYWNLHDLFTLYDQCKSIYFSLQVGDLE